MAFTRKENKTATASIPYASFPNKSVFIHGSTTTRTWRTAVIAALSGSEVLLLDPWKDSWSSYVDALQAELDAFQDLKSRGITSGVGGEGTGIVGGYTPMVIPDIENTPYFWEKRNSEACDFHFFVFDHEESAEHVILQMSEAIRVHPNKVVLHIPKEDWRINYSIFAKDLPRENFFGNFDHAVTRLKLLMGI